jgi:hypothetical protein
MTGIIEFSTDTLNIEVSGINNNIPVDLVEVVSTGQDVYVNVESNYGPVLAVNGRIGFVNLDKSDVGLSNVENISITGVSGYLQYQIDNLDTGYASQTEINILSGLLAQTGASLYTTITNLSGAVVAGYATKIELNNSGSFLYNLINSLSGYGNNTFATILNLASTGQNLQNQINNLDSIYATDASLSQTGQFLDQKIDTFSGTYQNFVNNLDTNYASQSEFDTLSGNLNLTGQNLDNKINSLSGAAVLTYGDQYIDGQKIFRGEVRIKDLYVTGTETIINTTNTNVGSNYILLNATGGAIDAGIFIVTGSGLTGISDTGAIIGYDVPANRWVFGNASRDSDLSQLDRIAGITDIANYSGFVNSNFYPLNNPSGFITGVDLSQYLTGVDLSAYVTRSGGQFIDRPTLNGTGFLLSGEAAALPETIVYTTGDQTISGIKDFTVRPTVNGTGVLLSGEEQNTFKANYCNDHQRSLHSNLFGRKGNIQLKNTVLPNLTSGDFVFNTIYPDSAMLNVEKPILLAKPYLTVRNTDNSQDSYYSPESEGGGGGPDPISSTNFVNLNPEGPHIGLALQHVRFHPIIQNAYKKYYLRFGQNVTIPMSNRYLESFIEIVWPSGEYWSVTNSGIDKYIYDVNINPTKNQTFTQSHVVNFKIIFERDDRVGTATNYDSRVINFNYNSNYGSSSFSISGLDYEFIQKERVILTTNNAMQRW